MIVLERKRIKPLTPMLAFILCSRTLIWCPITRHFQSTLITFKHVIMNPIFKSLNSRSFECPCHHKGHLIKHGFYTRKIKTSHFIIPLKIQRFKCKHCHHTHAFLLSVIIPYSQILFHDTLSIIRSNIMQDLNQLMIENPNIDESNISYIKKQYSMHWKQRLLSENIQLDSSLVFQCFFHFKRQFMQIKCTPNILYSPTHIA